MLSVACVHKDGPTIHNWGELMKAIMMRLKVNCSLSLPTGDTV